VDYTYKDELSVLKWLSSRLHFNIYLFVVRRPSWNWFQLQCGSLIVIEYTVGACVDCNPCCCCKLVNVWD
jgi:hypothetical protein